MFRSKSPPNRHGGGVLSVEEERAQSKERARSRERPHAAGRGGAGNIRSLSRSVPVLESDGIGSDVRRSRDPAQRKAEEEKVKALNAEEREAEAKHEADQKDHPDKFPVGRGGAGNVGPSLFSLCLSSSRGCRSTEVEQ